MQVIGISNEPVQTIENFIADQGITFPVLRDNASVYGRYNIPGGQSPYPRDYIIDENGIIQMAKTEYDPGTMINIIESLLTVQVAIEDEAPVIPTAIKVYPSYPNPFNSTVTIQFELYQPDQVSIRIFDINGRLQTALIDGQTLNGGIHTYQWQTRNNTGSILASGLYIIEIATATEQHRLKTLLIK